MKWPLILFTFISQTLWAYDPYQIKNVSDSIVCDHTYLELKNTPPIREQGSIGICYAFSSLLLLEHLKCSQAVDPSSCYASNRASAVDMTKYLRPEKNEIVIGGDPVAVLSKFSTKRKLVNESCTYLDNWKQLGYQPEYEDYFHQIHDSIRRGANHDDILCYALDLNQQSLGPVDELYNTLSRAKNMSVGQLRTALLYKKNCSAPDIDFPQYQRHTYPSSSENKTQQGIFNFVKKNLDASAPIEVSFCAQKDDQGQCYYHSTVITGMRNVCSASKCTVQYKIQNSYGKSWQDMYDDGWVNSTLINESIINTPGLSLNSITPHGKSLQSSTYNAHSSRPSGQGSCGTSSPISSPKKPESKVTIFECKDSQGQVHFSSEPLTGMFCRAR